MDRTSREIYWWFFWGKLMASRMNVDWIVECLGKTHGSQGIDWLDLTARRGGLVNVDPGENPVKDIAYKNHSSAGNFEYEVRE